ncbi:MAG: hypothetical protein ACRDH5_17800 [bacterium]
MTLSFTTLRRFNPAHGGEPLAKAKAAPYMKSFVVVVEAGVRSLDVQALRAEIGAWLADRAPTSTQSPTGCRTIAGPGSVVICQGDCRRPGEVCEVKRTSLPGGGVQYRCVCQRPIAQATARSRSSRPARRAAKK